MAAAASRMSKGGVHALAVFGDSVPQALGATRAAITRQPAREGPRWRRQPELAPVTRMILVVMEQS